MIDVSDWTAQLRRGVLELCILALIDQAPSYGYEIVTLLGQAPSLAVPEGTIYPLLRRLRREGYVETYWQESASGPPRQYYRLTQAGAEALAAMQRQWREVVRAVDRYIPPEGREPNA